MATEPPVAIRTFHLSKRYQSGQNTITIFDDLNLAVRSGERLALVGESGAGKSTLLHLLGGLDRPTLGRIQFGDKDITTLNESGLADFRNREIGFVWQTHYLLPEFTAKENVMMPLLIRGVRRAEALRSAEERLDEVGLGQRTHHMAGELSGGEQQRVVIARALVGRPKVLLADEPTGNLDHGTGERVADVFDEIHRLHGLTSVFVTHNIGFARRCDRILHLEDGALIPYDDEPAAPRLTKSSAPLATLQRESVSDKAAGKDGTDYV
ncbi:MAG: ABC transporter ATP-binding protein [Bryobacteraceae bacterium]|nr:ABC transporter ATP-binding protein [Bryobacteraceae bacterium]